MGSKPVATFKVHEHLCPRVSKYRMMVNLVKIVHHDMFDSYHCICQLLCFISFNLQQVIFNIKRIFHQSIVVITNQ